MRSILETAQRAILGLIGTACMLPHCAAQPSPAVAAVVNSASYSDSVIAQGSIFVVFGDELGPSELQQVRSYPLPFFLSGTSITVTAGGAAFNCPMIYTSFHQVAAILPSSTPIGDATLIVSNSGSRSEAIHFKVNGGAPGIYTTSASGIGPGVITGVDYVTKSFNRSARPGETLIVWATGLGAVEGDDAVVPSGGKQFPDVEVFVGNNPAKVTYAGRSGCCAGLDQIAFQIPDTPLGCFVPVALRRNGVVSNFVTVAIDASGQTCSNAVPGVPREILLRALAGEPLKIGAVAIGPVVILQGAGFSFSQLMADQLSTLLKTEVLEQDVRRLMHAYALGKKGTVKQILAKYRVRANHIDRRLVRLLQSSIGIDRLGAGAAFGTLRGLSGSSPEFASNFAAVGTCTVTRGLSPPDSRSRSADAGAQLTLSGPLGLHTLGRVSNGQYAVSLGSGFPNGTVPPGTYVVTGPGGSDVGPFTASLTTGNALVWTNRPDMNTVDRTRPLTFQWTGGPAPGFVLIGGSVRQGGATTGFLCVEDSRKGSFTVPGFVLSTLPAATPRDAYLFLGIHPFSNPVSIPRVDLAYIADGGSDYQTVTIR